ncbi:MAG: IPT/TIG domain-containing protein [bacterium]
MARTQTASDSATRRFGLVLAALVAAFALFSATGMPAQAAGLPVVTNVVPDFGPPAGGNSVVVQGTNLTAASGVTVGGVSVPFVVTNSTHISIAEMPAHAAGNADIRVTSSDDIVSSNTSADDYLYVAEPTVSGISPDSGPGSGGTLVTITGTGLTGATALNFGNVAAPNYSVVNDSVIVVQSPAHTPGTVTIQVTTPGGTSAVVVGAQFTYDAVTTISGLSPDRGPAGTTVTIYGSGFTGATSVSFGGTFTSFVVLSDNIINAIAPAHAVGPVNVMVTSPTGASAAVAESQYTYATDTDVTGISPTSGPVGTTVTIRGSGFLGATSVRFGGSFATFTVINDTMITAVSPAHALGTVDVVVGKSGQTSDVVTAGQYTYTANVPTISSLTPNNGSSGTMITIIGTGFTGTTSVVFGGSFTAFTVISDTMITATSPAHVLGTFQVVVTTPSGVSVFTSAGNFVFRLNFCPVTPHWTDDLAYGSAGGGFYWDSTSGLVWTAQRGWHLFSPFPAGLIQQPFWVDALTYGSIGGGFYWDSVSGQVWTAQRGWHLYSAENCT